MKTSFLKILPCLDSDEMATSRRQELNIPQSLAADLGNSAVKAAMLGYYNYEEDTKVDWNSLVQTAISLKISIPPDAELPFHESDLFPETQVQVSNETTLLAAHRLIAKGFKPLALNFANGIHPGGGFLHGARAQEETLCRSSAFVPHIIR